MAFMAQSPLRGALVTNGAGAGQVRFHGGTEAPIHPDSHAFIAHIETLRSAEDGMLRRAAIAPRALLPMLPNLFMADRGPAGWRYRLCGTALVDRLGVEATGRAVHDLFEAETASRICGLYDTVVSSRLPISRRGRFIGIGRDFFVTESTQFPMLGRDGESWMVLGAMFYLDATTMQPI